MNRKKPKHRFFPEISEDQLTTAPPGIYRDGSMLRSLGVSTVWEIQPPGICSDGGPVREDGCTVRLIAQLRMGSAA